jgi:tRNA-2-methylthio-N6-dimethylallyladenosine synthase
MSFSFAINVYGCQMNQYDGDRLRTALTFRGWKETDTSQADVVIIVTCSIREKAEQKVLSEIGRYKKAFGVKGKPILAVIGCMAQNMGVELIRRFPQVRVVVGPRHIGLVPDALEKALRNKVVVYLDEDPREMVDLKVTPIIRSNPFKAFVTIAHGCDNFCTYCIVPYVRGRFVSRRPDEILEEVSELVEDGILEVTLLGQNVDSYGKDFCKGYRFSDLLRDVSHIPGLLRVRFTTSHPRDFTDDVIEVMAEEPKICPAVNLPIQSGSDRILKKMNRGYTVSGYEGIIRRLRNAIPDISITSDLIVGFPGEIEEDFTDTLNMLERMQFDLVHTASYSPREGTPAAVLPDQISQEEKKRRLAIVNELQDAISFKKNLDLVGKVVEVLFDDLAPKGGGLLQGRTPTDKVVLVPGDETMLGKLYEVRITEASNWYLYGELVSLRDFNDVLEVGL